MISRVSRSFSRSPCLSRSKSHLEVRGARQATVRERFQQRNKKAIRRREPAPQLVPIPTLRLRYSIGSLAATATARTLLHTTRGPRRCLPPPAARPRPQQHPGIAIPASRVRPPPEASFGNVRREPLPLSTPTARPTVTRTDSCSARSVSSKYLLFSVLDNDLGLTERGDGKNWCLAPRVGQTGATLNAWIPVTWRSENQQYDVCVPSVGLDRLEVAHAPQRSGLVGDAIGPSRITGPAPRPPALSAVYCV